MTLIKNKHKGRNRKEGWEKTRKVGADEQGVWCLVSGVWRRKESGKSAGILYCLYNSIFDASKASMTHPRKVKQQDQEQVTCPRCAGNKRILDFRGGDRRTDETAGWKAVPCPGCAGAGMGSVDEAITAATLAKMQQDSPG